MPQDGQEFDLHPHSREMPSMAARWIGPAFFHHCSHGEQNQLWANCRPSSQAFQWAGFLEQPGKPGGFNEFKWSSAWHCGLCLTNWWKVLTIWNLLAIYMDYMDLYGSTWSLVHLDAVVESLGWKGLPLVCKKQNYFEVCLETFLARHRCHGASCLLDDGLVGIDLLLPLGWANAQLHGHAFPKQQPFHSNGQHLLAFGPHVQP